MTGSFALPEGYTPSEFVLDKVTSSALGVGLKGTRLDIFTAVWCPDCLAQVPRLKSILDSLDEPPLVNVYNMKKGSPPEQAISANVKALPTIIVYRNDGEIGRIIEFPKTTLEGDLIDITRVP